MSIESLTGRMVDLDSHLQLAPRDFPTALGPEFGERFRQQMERRLGGPGVLDRMIESRGEPPDEQTVWTRKLWAAHGAFDPSERLEALDLMGIDTQVVFPMAILAAVVLAGGPTSHEVARRYNDFVLDWAAPGGGRLRPVALVPTDDVEAALAEARRTIERGAFGINVGCGRPPGGLSPADPAWDPLWSLLEESRTPVFLHIGGEVGFVDSAWGRTEPLVGARIGGGAPDGEVIGPFELATVHFGPQTFITALVLSGVLERHPGLRIGAIELTAQWVGPMAELLDQRAAIFRSRLASTLSMKPSEYLSRQLRVTPFFWEPTGTYIERYGLEDVYVFSTDYPHIEGGTQPVTKMFEAVAPLGDAVVEKFFVTNGRLLVPPR